jgi:hypothetical protein
VQVPDVSEKRGKSRNNCLFGRECKEPNIVREIINYTEQVLGAPRPGLFERAKDVKAEGLKASCGFGALFGVDSRMV